MVKVERSHPAPISLEAEKKKVSGTYNKSDVTEQLRKDFNEKCYICELGDLTDAEVEHLKPHENGKYIERKFDWNNLFLVCPHCNKIKKKKIYSKGIIDCCERDPEELIELAYQNEEVVVCAKVKKDEEVELTVQLLDEVYNLRNTGIRRIASEARMKKLSLEMRFLYKQLERYTENVASKRLNKSMRGILSRSSAFSAFKRGYVRANIEKYPELQEYLA